MPLSAETFVAELDAEHRHALDHIIATSARAGVLELAVTDDAQAAARDASRRVLSTAEELQENPRLEMGISHAPGR